VRLDDATRLEDLGPEECLRLLATQHLGRIGMVVDGQPMVLPVNYALLGETIVFRTARGSGFDRLVRRAEVVFEIDHADPAFHSGWSVIGRGTAEGIDERIDTAALERLVQRPWARQVPAGWIAVPLRQVTGRRIVQVPES
jgi:uncharacterized protein